MSEPAVSYRPKEERWMVAFRIATVLEVIDALCTAQPSDTDLNAIATNRHIGSLAALCRDAADRLAVDLEDGGDGHA